MKVTIHKGHHWPGIITRLRQFGINTKPWIERDVVFDHTASYDLPGDDRFDVNKLFGIGYLNGFHQKDSARFGWNYNHEAGRIRLYAYCYVKGDRIIKPFCEILPYQKVKLIISVSQSGNYIFSVYGGTNNWRELALEKVSFAHKKKWKYNLGSYFGGSRKAPHDIRINISRK